MNEKIEQEAMILEIMTKNSLLLGLESDDINNIEKAMQEFGNQRFNAALSEAIETLDKSGLQIFSMSTIRSVLEGLKIK